MAFAVIASAAKQSRGPALYEAGLLRCARKDDGAEKGKLLLGHAEREQVVHMHEADRALVVIGDDQRGDRAAG